MMINTLKNYSYVFKKVLTIPVREINFSNSNNKFDFEGKFFRVNSFNKNQCLKRMIKKERANIILDLANIVVITTLLEEKILTPNIHAIYIDLQLNNVAICVSKTEAISTDMRKYGSDFLHFLSNIINLTDRWKIRRLPYNGYPYDNTFLLEINHINNLGIFLGKIVLVDIDPKCYSNNKLIKFAALILKNRISYNINKFKKHGSK